MRGNTAVETFKKSAAQPWTPVDVSAFSYRENVMPQSMATAKHNFRKLIFNPPKKMLVDFIDEL